MLCKELYEILSNGSTPKVYKLTFAPNQTGVNEPFFISEEPESIEIVCFKSTYLSIFIESHNYFQNYELISGM